jgi:hypothetical protein
VEAAVGACLAKGDTKAFGGSRTNLFAIFCGVYGLALEFETP